MVGVEEGDVPVEEMVEEGEDNPDDRIEAEHSEWFQKNIK